MIREWSIHTYKARLDSAIEAEHWDEADRVRIAVKRRLLELVSQGGGKDAIAAARNALADSLDRLRLSRRVRIDKGPLAMATALMADAETAGIAAEQSPLPHDTARDVKERIIQILSSGNRRPLSTSDLADATKRRVETVARAISQLRAERKIISRRVGRHVLHRLAEPNRNTLTSLLHTQNGPASKVDIQNTVEAISSTKIPFLNTTVIYEDDTVDAMTSVKHMLAQNNFDAIQMTLHD